MVVISKTSGNALNSVGFSIKMAVISTMQAMVIESASAISNSQAGIGRIKMTSIRIMPRAKRISPRLVEATSSSLKDLAPNIAALFCGFLAIIRVT